MKITVKRDDLIKAVRKLAAADPAHVYQQTSPVVGVEGVDGCLYSDLGVEQCLIGQAFIESGVDMSDLRYADQAEFGDIEGLINEDYLEVVGASERDIAWLTSVQRHQDSGITWGTAIHSADHSDVL